MHFWPLFGFKPFIGTIGKSMSFCEWQRSRSACFKMFHLTLERCCPLVKPNLCDLILCGTLQVIFAVVERERIYISHTERVKSLYLQHKLCRSKYARVENTSVLYYQQQNQFRQLARKVQLTL